MWHFYSQIYKDSQISIAKDNIFKSTNILKSGIEAYIKTMEDKNLKVQCNIVERIEKINYSPGKFFKKPDNVSTLTVELNEQEYNIKPFLKDEPTGKIYLFDKYNNKVSFDGNSYEIQPNSIILLKENYDKIYIKANIEGEDYDLLNNEIKQGDNITQAEKPYPVSKVNRIKNNKYDIEIDGILKNGEDIYFNGKNITSLIKDRKIPEISDYMEVAQNICYHSSLQKGAKELKDKHLLEIKEIREKFEEKNYKLDAYNKSDYKFEPMYITIAGKKIKLELETKRYVQLELSDTQNESTIDYLDILFNEKFFLKDDKCKYDIDVIDKDEKIVILKKDNKEHNLEKDKELLVEIDVSNYKKQKKALQLIRHTPYKHLNNLLKLFEDKDKVSFEQVIDKKIDKNEIIDKDKEGAEEQKDFVQKAIGTPDFAFLSGPPGSGKTTVILELICQLIKDNKRILLCGSTHVAIDNVLERLDDKGLVEKFNIVPLRIGLNERVSDKIKKYSYSNMVESYKQKGMKEEFLHYASNLVCGTTMGILNYIPFKDFFKNSNNIKDDLLFDYLIIDESSKTTFQEFLVPAIFAKKWILAGDIHQLPPYVEQDFLEKVLDNIGNDDEKNKVNNYLKQACIYLEQAKYFIRSNKNDNNKIAVLISEKINNELYNEYNNRCNIDIYKKIYTIKDKNNVDIKKLFNANVVFFTNETLKFIPQNFLILAEENNCKILAHDYQSRAYYGSEEYSKLDEKRNNSDILNKKWAQEISWRIDRCNQLRIFDNNTSKKVKTYNDDIGDIMPIKQKDKLIELIDEHANILLPSILALLEKGASSKRAKKDSVLNSGFKDNDFKKRNSVLVFQYRMHKEISAFPRKEFYKGEALKDAAEIDREWDLKYYKKRIVWIDVVNGKQDVVGSKTVNANSKEVEIVLAELDKFIKFAKDNKKPDSSKWSVGILSFYVRQVKIIRKKLQEKFKTENQSRFEKDNVEIKLSTVDKFQGDERDIVFLSMVKTDKDGFLDSPYRLNVAITRARYQLVVVGKRSYFKKISKTKILNDFANQDYEVKEIK